jgi:hypothetical protein
MMKTKNGLLALRVRMALISMALFLTFGVLGCADSRESTQQEKKNAKSGDMVAFGSTGGSEHKVDDTIDGFWCEPHGLPEDECWKCNKKFCRECEAKGDWCKDHLRPKSQCFKCDPTLIEKWAKVYEERTGKVAPKPRNY